MKEYRNLKVAHAGYGGLAVALYWSSLWNLRDIGQIYKYSSGRQAGCRKAEIFFVKYSYLIKIDVAANIVTEIAKADIHMLLCRAN